MCTHHIVLGRSLPRSAQPSHLRALYLPLHPGKVGYGVGRMLPRANEGVYH